MVALLCDMMGLDAGRSFPEHGRKDTERAMSGESVVGLVKNKNGTPKGAVPRLALPPKCQAN